jgi:Xaa-Pro dipeptidase
MANTAELQLEPRLQAILAQDYPRFSDAEYARRHKLLAGVMEKAGVDHLLIVTDQRAGNAPQWVTGWPGTVEAFVIFKPGEKPLMHVEWYNHTPLATRIAQTTDVRWGEHRGIVKTIDELKRRGAKKIGLIGPLAIRKYKLLAAAFDVTELDGDYVKLRQIKSEEEIDWLRIGAALSDLALAALLRETRPGRSERELANEIERAYVGYGGATMLHYLGITPMADPQICVPRQHHSPRRVQAGDVVFCELSAAWWDYSGQVLRTFTVGAEPTPLYRDLYATAEAAFEAVTTVVRDGAAMQDVLDATGVIEKNGFTIFDDLMHGFGGGYFQPIIGTKSRPAGPLPDMTLQENMTLVVQPNVITRDQKAGVQVGEMIRVTRTGFERLHRADRRFSRVD